MNDHYYDVELRGKYTGVIYKSFQTRVYKEALKLSKLYLPCVEEINDVEAFALIKKMVSRSLKLNGMKSLNLLKKRGCRL